VALAKQLSPGRKRAVASWALWDWGTQPYYTVITTFVFTVYITSSAFATEGNLNGPTQALSVATFLGGVVIALVSPVIGETADRTGHTVRSLRWLTWGLALISMALYFVAPSPGYLWLGLGLMVVGTVLGEFASVHYNTLLQRVATPRTIGRVSGFGWGMGYIGGILVLLLILVLFINPPVGLFGITDCPGSLQVVDGAQEWVCDGDYTARKIRAAMILCGIWTLLFTAPLFLIVKDKPQDGAKPARLGVIGSYKSLFRNIAELWRTQRQTSYFLLASALFRDGLAGVFTFGAVIGARSFGFGTTTIIIFGAAASLIAGVVTILVGLIDDRIGPKRVILICLGILVAGALIIFSLHEPVYTLTEGMDGYDAEASRRGQVIFWIFGLMLSGVVGPAQSASRSFLTRVTPEGHAGEVFGLYTMTGRAISFLTPGLFGLLVSLGAAVTGEASTQHWGMLGIAAVLAAGFCVLLPVRAAPRARDLPAEASSGLVSTT
jgi:UMF1 family MFS transporter